MGALKILSNRFLILIKLISNGLYDAIAFFRIRI